MRVKSEVGLGLMHISDIVRVRVLVRVRDKSQIGFGLLQISDMVMVKIRSQVGLGLGSNPR